MLTTFYCAKNDHRWVTVLSLKAINEYGLAKANNARGAVAEREGDRAKTAQLLQEAVQKLWVDEVDALCEHFGAGWMGGCTTRSRLNYGVNK